MNDITAEERAWTESAGRALRASEDDLDAMTLMRLRSARARAIAEARAHSRPRAINWGVPMALAAGLTTWALLPRLTVHDPAGAPQQQVAMGEALDLMTDEHGPDFYQDLEFYQWMQARKDHA